MEKKVYNIVLAHEIDEENDITITTIKGLLDPKDWIIIRGNIFNYVRVRVTQKEWNELTFLLDLEKLSMYI